jgi:type I restriction enzyme S subunit
MYTNYQSRIDSLDTYATAKEGSLYSKGDEVVVPASGETAEDIAVASSVRLPGVMLGGDLNVMVPCDNLDPDFLAIGISNGYPHRQIAMQAQGKSIVHIHGDDIAEVNFAFPCIKEQRSIANTMLEFDNLITLHQRKLEFLKRIKQSCLDKMFV